MLRSRAFVNLRQNLFKPWQEKRPTLFGRAILLIAGELAFNTICWIAAGICLSQAEGLIGLALLAWTIGLRHGLDADHISAIDNATRQLVSRGQLPITCGLWFSLGHSTIVIVVNIALAISVDIYNKLDNVGSVGGIIGTSISASFLFLIACINTYFLVTAIKARRRARILAERGLPPDDPEAASSAGIQGGGCLVRIIGPVLRAVDKPWKMYPVGILFGFGFDTASSIALLAISAIAQRGPNGQSISHGKIVILPFLFTAGMSLVDSLDSILMLYAYATPHHEDKGQRFALFLPEKPVLVPMTVTESLPILPEGGHEEPIAEGVETCKADVRDMNEPPFEAAESSAPPNRIMDVKADTMSTLSIILTVLSILVALSISLIEIMGLIGEHCSACQAAANAPDGGGLAGKWWRGWANANDQSGYIGAAIVGCFGVILLGWYLGRWVLRWYMRRNIASGYT